MQTKIIDTKSLALDPRQRARLGEALPALKFLKSISISDKKGVWVESESEVTAEQTDLIINTLRGLPATLLAHEQEAIDYKKLPFCSMPWAELDQFIDSNITDIATAKAFMKKIAHALVYLSNKIGIK